MRISILPFCFAVVTSAAFALPDVFVGSQPYREATFKGVRNDRLDPVWMENGARLWFRTQGADGAGEFTLVDAVSGKKEPLFDHIKLRAALTAATVPADTVSALRLENIRPAVGSLLFSLVGKTWTWTAAGELKLGDAAGVNSAGPVPRASASGGPEMNLRIRNESGGPVTIHWLDTNGRRQSYGRIANGGTGEQHTFTGHVWLITDAASRDLIAFAVHPDRPEITVKGPEEIRWEGPPRERRRGRSDMESPRAKEGDTAPDGQRTAFIRDHNLYVRTKDGQEKALTTNGTAADHYDGPFFWSPDSTRLAAMRFRPIEERKVTAVRSSPTDQLQPKVETWNYAKPGDPLPYRRPRLFDVIAGTKFSPDESLFATPFDIGDYHWAPDSSAFHCLYNQRGHQLLRIIALDRDGKTRALFDEKADTFVDYSQKTFLYWLDAPGEFLWMSERSGWNHLYLCDAKTGAIKNPVTSGDWVVRNVEHVDVEKRQIELRVMGIHKGQDPYHMHFARVNFDGTGFTVLTQSDGSHTISYAPDRETFIATWSRIDHAPVHELRRSDDGHLLCELSRADITALTAVGWPQPERLSGPGRDGKTEIYGFILRPWKMDPAKLYPVIEYIYAGPHDFHVPKEFRAWNRHYELANLGFVIVFIDGMGTNWRSRAFHDVAWQNIGDAGFPDRISWMKAAAATRPYMDITRVGIYGGSAGGQNAMMALIAHGDFYKAAVADCGCHDNRMDKIWWNEAWMGYPIGDHYIASSNVEQAHRLKGNLLLTVGEVDTNVDPASTMQVVHALIKAEKDFELLILPNANHGAGESPYAAKRRALFFQRHLQGTTPVVN